MAEEAPQTQSTPTEPLGNQPGARNSDGSLKTSQEQAAAASQTSSTTPAAQPPTKAAEPAPKPGEGSLAGGKTPEKPVGAPETYADFKAPEGYEWDKDKVAAASALFKESGLSQEQAQKFMDLYAQDMQSAANAPFDAFVNLRNEWRDSVISDPTLGNGRDNLKPEVLATIGRAIDGLPNASEFREAMALTGAGDNPAFVKAFYHMAKAMGEGTAVRGGGPAPTGQVAPGSRPNNPAAAMYPHLAGNS